MRIARISTGFQDIPGKVSLNIFLTGCTIKCKNCHNPQLQDYDSPHEVFTPAELAESIARAAGMIDCVTWMGGEPTDHPDIREGMEAVKRRLPGLKQCMYTGRSIGDPRAHRLLDMLDLVVAEPYKGRGISAEGTNQIIWVKVQGGWSPISYNEFSRGRTL